MMAAKPRGRREPPPARPSSTPPPLPAPHPDAEAFDLRAEGRGRPPGHAPRAADLPGQTRMFGL